MINKEKLNQLLQTNWASFIDTTSLLRRVLIDARNANYTISDEFHKLAPQTKMTITNFQIFSNYCFEIWVEFIAAGEDSMIIGSHIYHLQLNGDLTLKDTYGSIFKTQS